MGFGMEDQMVRSSRSGYVDVARTTRSQGARSIVCRVMAFTLAFVMVAALGVGTAASMSQNDIRDIVDRLGVGNSSEWGSGLARIGLSTAYADDTDCDADKNGDCDEKGKAQFDKFKGSSMKDAGFEGTSDLQQDESGSVDSNWMASMDLADKNTNYDEGGENGIKKSTKLSDVFSMVLKRLMPGYYLNNITPTEDDVYAWKDWECADLDSDPTLENANCDVPNITTEGVQNLVALFDDHGLQNYQLRKAQTPFGLGFAKELLPTDDVPVNLKDAQYKYTALEAFGYNLAWTSYNGEWDHIAVMTENRMKSSMTLGDGAKTVGQSIGDAAAGMVNGTVEGFKSGVNDIVEDAKNGNWAKAAIGAVFLPFKALWNGVKTAVASGLYRLLNNLMNGFEYTSVQNKAWYRPSFISETVYGLTALTEVEKNAVINKRIEDAANEGIKEAMNEIPEEETELSIRQKYPVPTPPWVKYDPDEEQTWGSWTQENMVRLIPAQSLGIDMSKYEKDEFANQTSVQRYQAFSQDWKAGVDAKVQEAKDAYNDKVRQMVKFKVDTRIKKDVYKDYASRPASAWMFCSEGEPEDDGVKSAMDAGRIRKVGKEAFKYTWDDKGRMTSATYQCATPVRPTIVGGLLGSSRKNTTGKTDTRRTAYNMGWRLMQIYLKGTPWKFVDFDAMGASLLFVSQRITMVMNTLVGWSFEPILEKFKIKTIIMDWTKKLRDTVYMEFIVMVIAIAAMMVVWRLIRGNPIESFKQLAAIVLTAGLGIMLLFNTDMMFKLVDDVPTGLERAVMGTVLESAGSDKICKASGSPKNTVSASATFSAMFGDGHDFDPDAQVRVLQCKIWTAFVFTPWTYGQFGAGWNELWANGHRLDGGAGASELATSAGTNELVGDAGVPLGGNNTVNNWALYQVAHTTSGTVTTQDMDRTPGTHDKAMYRLVDAQAGPEQGMGRDATHFSAWSSNTMERALIGAMSIFTATTGLIGIGGLCVKKIQYTLTVTLMLLISPIIMLLGIMPGKNQLRMKQYGWEIVSLCLKRISMVLIMCVGIEAIVEIGMASTGSWFGSLFAMAIVAVVIKFYGKELADKMTATVNSKAGQWQSANDVVRNAVANNDFLTNLSDTAKSGFTAVAGGMIGGMMAGNLTRSLKSARKDAASKFLDSFSPRSVNTATVGAFSAFARNVAANGGGIDLMEALNAGRALSKSQLNELKDIDAATGSKFYEDYQKNKAKYQQGAKLELARQMLERDKQGLDFETGTVLSLGERKARREEMWRQLQQMGVAKSLSYVPTVSGMSMMRQEVQLINKRLMRNRLAQGRTSVLWEHMKKQHRKRGEDPFKAEKTEILRMMNQTGFDTEGVLSKVNHAMFNGVNMGAKLSVEDSVHQLNQGDKATMLTADNLKMLIMSAQNPHRLKHDIEVAMAEGGAAWDKVAADLMDGNVIDKRSKAYQMAWGIDPTNEVIRNYDTAGVKARFDAGDAETVRNVQKAREQVAKMNKKSVASVTDDQAIAYLVSRRMESGDAAFEMANDSMRNNEKTRALKQEQEASMDIIMAGTVYTDENGNPISREEAKYASPAKRMRQEEDRKALQEKVSKRRTAVKDEKRKVSELDRKISKLEEDIALGEVVGAEAVKAAREIEKLRKERKVHARAAESYENNARADEAEFRHTYDQVGETDRNWQDVARANVEATLSAMGLNPSLNGDASRVANFGMIDARTGRPLLDAMGNQITFDQYTKEIAKVSAINETIAVNNSTASMYNLQAQAAGSWGRKSPKEQRIMLAQATQLAQSQDPSARCTGFDTTTGKFLFTTSTSKPMDSRSFAGGTLGASRGGISDDGTRSNMADNLARYESDKVYGGNGPTTARKREKVEERREEAKRNIAATGGNNLREAFFQDLDGHGGQVFVDAHTRNQCINTTMDTTIISGAARGNAVDAARNAAMGLLDFARKHHTDNYDNRTKDQKATTREERRSHVSRPRRV